MSSQALAAVGFLGPILFGIAILVVLRFSPRAGTSGSPDVLRESLSLGGVILIAAGFCGTLFMGLGGAAGIVLGAVLSVLSLVVIAMSIQRWRIAHFYAMLWTLTAAAERMIPLARAAEAFGQERGFFLGGRAKRLARLLQGGWALPDALKKAGGPLGRDVLAYIRVGHHAGALAQSLREAVTAVESRQSLWGHMAAKFAYLIVIPLWALVVLVFMMLKISPAFQKIFADFGAALPAATQALFTVSDFFANYWYLFFWLPILMLFLLAYSVLRYIGLIDWDLPGTGWVMRRVHAATLMDALALTVEREQPISQTLLILAHTYPRLGIRWRLRRVLMEVNQGMHWCQSMHGQGLIGQAELAVLQSAERLGNLPWALREMADSARRRLVYRLQATMQIFFPLVIVAYAAVVGAFAIGYMLPLVVLISTLAKV